MRDRAYYWRVRSWRERLLTWPWTPWYSLAPVRPWSSVAADENPRVIRWTVTP